MASARHLARRSAVQLLYAHEMGCGKPELLMEENKLGEKYKAFALELYGGAKAYGDQINARLSAVLPDQWPIERLGCVERAILRLACYELLFSALDAPVVINEAVELAKELADDNAPTLINGILETIRKNRAKA